MKVLVGFNCFIFNKLKLVFSLIFNIQFWSLSCENKNIIIITVKYYWKIILKCESESHQCNLMQTKKLNIGTNFLMLICLTLE